MSLASPQRSNASPTLHSPHSPLSTPSPGAQSNTEQLNVPGEEQSPDVGSEALKLSPLQGPPATDSATAIQNSLYAILGHGNFQRCVVACAALSLTVYVTHAFAYRIIARPVDHWCRRPDDLRQVSLDVWRNVAIPVEADGQLSRCTVFDPPFSEDSYDERHAVHCQAWEYDIGRAKDSIVSHWDLVCDRQWLFSISYSVFMLGSAIFTPVAGWMSDRFGRKPVVSLAAGTLLGASLCAAGSQSFPLFLMARFVIAGSASATSLLLLTLIFEVTGNEWRALHSLLATSIGGTVPLPLLEVVSTLHPSWELAQAVLLLPTALLIVWCNMLDESPSWLVATLQLSRAQQVVIAAARTNALDVNKAKHEFQKLKRHIRPKDQGQSTSVSALSTGSATEGSRRAAALQRRALSVAITWFNLTFAYYTLAMLTVKRGGYNQAAHFVIQTLTFLGVCRFLIKRGQRETLTVALSSVSLAAGACFAANFLALSPLLPTLQSLALCQCTAALAICYGYTAEVFPISSRSTGICISYSIGRLGALLSSFLFAFKGVADSAAMEAAIVALVLVAAVAVQWLPEVFLDMRATKTQSPVALSPEEQKKALRASLRAVPSPRKQRRRREDHRKPRTTLKPCSIDEADAKPSTERPPIASASATPKK